MIKRFLSYIWTQAHEHNVDNIVSLLKNDKKAVVVDIGCGDGRLTVKYKNKIGCQFIIGADGVKKRLSAAEKKGVDKIVCFNFEKKWKLPRSSFDVVISNQVIEHIHNIDNYISEIYRILKPGGYCIISTENLSSWHNIIALILGYQDFSHHLIMKTHTGNPFSLHCNEKTCTWSAANNSGIDDTAFPHIKIPTYRSLMQIFKSYGFVYIAGKGSGYYPLFGIFSFFASRVDPYHSHFITIKLLKPGKKK